MSTGAEWRARAPVVVALAVAVALVAGTSTPAGSSALGVVSGAAVAAGAVALVLVYRSDRIVNFAQLGFAVIPAALLAQFTTRRQFLVWLHDGCNSCVPLPDAAELANAALDSTANPALLAVDLSELSNGRIAALAADGWLVTANDVLSIALALLVGPAVAWLVHRLVIRPLRSASRVTVTVVTIGVGQVLAAGAGLLPGLFGAGPLALPSRPPITASFDVGGAVLTESDVAIVALAVATALGTALLWRSQGRFLRARAAAANPTLAAAAGIDPDAESSRTWVLAGLLGGTVGVLSAMAGSSAGGSIAAAVPLVAAMVVGGFSAPVRVAVAACAFGVIGVAGPSTFDRAGLTDALVLVLVLGALLWTAPEFRRADAGAADRAAVADEVRPVPAQLRPLPAVRRLRDIGVGALLLLVAGLPALLTPSQLVQAQVAAALAVVGLSVLVLSGWAGEISLGQLAVGAVGAWAAALTGAPFLVAIVVAAVAGAVTAAVVGVPALRLSGVSLAVATLALAAAVPGVVLGRDLLGSGLPDRLERPVFLGVDFGSQAAYWWLSSGVLLLGALVAVRLRRSRTGRVLLASRDNPAAARAAGIDLRVARIGGFVIAGAYAGVGAYLYTLSLGSIDPRAFTVDDSVNVFLVAVVGGLGSVAGPLAGAAYFGLLRFLDDSPFVALLATGVPVLVVLRLIPGGIIAAYGTARDAILLRVADRNGLDVPELAGAKRLGTTDGELPIKPRRSTEAPVVSSYVLDSTS